MTIYLSSLAGAGAQFFDGSGVPLAGGLIYTYAAGTTTPQITYTSSSGNVPNSNPIVLNSSGRTDNEIWLIQGNNYKFILKDSTNVQIGSYDNLPGINDGLLQFEALLQSSVGASLVGYTQGSSNAVPTTVQAKLRQVVSVKDFGAVGDGITDDTVAIQNALNYVGSSGGGSVYIPNGTYGFTRLFITYSNVSMDGESTGGTTLQTIGALPSNYPSNPNGTSILTNPNAAISITPPNFMWGNSQDPNSSTVGTVSSVYLRNFRLAGWWSSAPPPYDGWNTNLTGQLYNDRSLGIIAICSAEIYYDELIITKMGAENSYSYNASISNCYIVGGGEVGALSEFGKVINCRVQSAYNGNGVGARFVSGCHIFSMPGTGLNIGGSNNLAGAIISNNYVHDCVSYCATFTDDGASAVAKLDFIVSNNVFKNSGQNAVVWTSYNNANSRSFFTSNVITCVGAQAGLYYAISKGKSFVSNNLITGDFSLSTAGISSGPNTSADLKIYIQNNFIYGFTIYSIVNDGVQINLGNYLGSEYQSAGLTKFPSYTTVAKNAVTTLTPGLVLYDSTLNKLCVYTGSAWETITSV